MIFQSSTSSNSLEPDQTHCYSAYDLLTNCLQMLSVLKHQTGLLGINSVPTTVHRDELSSHSLVFML